MLTRPTIRVAPDSVRDGRVKNSLLIGRDRRKAKLRKNFIHFERGSSDQVFVSKKYVSTSLHPQNVSLEVFASPRQRCTMSR
jgi:hypothetical protein